MDNETDLHCWNCGVVQTDVPLPLSRHDYCSACGEALHCCRQCVSFDPRAPAQCRESRAEPPTNRESANFCEWFVPVADGGANGRSAGDDARAKLDALFGPPDSVT